MRDEVKRTPQDQFTGKRGEKIIVGDHVAAAVRECNTATLKTGVVQEIYYQTGPYSYQNRVKVKILFEHSSRVSTMENTYNITKLEI